MPGSGDADATRHVPRPGAPFRDVTVLLGDPRLPDATKREGRFQDEDFDTLARLEEALAALPGRRFRFLDDHEKLLATLLADPPALVLNFCDTGYRNVASQELHVPALLEFLGIAYSGAGPGCLAASFDKALVRAVAAADGIPVPRERLLEPGDPAEVPAELLPALIKPNRADGSLGIGRDARVASAAEARACLARLRRELPGCALLVQEFLSGPEYSVALVGNPGLGFTPLRPLEVDFTGLDPGLPPILAFEAKCVPDSPYWTQIQYREASLPDAVARSLHEHSTRIFERLGCRDYARIDFRTDAGGAIKLLEVNPNPAWAYDGKLALMARYAGYSYPELLALILEAAEARLAAA